MSDHSIDYWQNQLPKCPHCGADFPVWSYDNPQDLNYEDGGRTNFDCRECEYSFTCVTSVHYKFSTAISEDAAEDELWGPQR